MRSVKSISILTSAIFALTLCACGSADNNNDTSQVTAAETAVTEQTNITGSEISEEPEIPETELSYMEKYKDLITEMPPEDILEERDGVKYPYFDKLYYYSNTAERDTPVSVLLPKDYSEDKEYPVLYILHGYWDNEDWMARDSVHISAMLNNLVADGEAEEMIVVCPYIFCSKDMQYCTGMDTENTLAYDNFINDMMTDLMPFIEKELPVAKGRENTAITGFSMGAREALYIGFSHPDKFGYIGSVCTAPGLVNGTGYPYNLERDEFKFTDISPYLLLLSAAEHDGVVGSNPMTYHNMLSDNGTEHLWHTMSKTGHDASSVTPHLYNFIRMIFKD